MKRPTLQDGSERCDNVAYFDRNVQKWHVPGKKSNYLAVPYDKMSFRFLACLMNLSCKKFSFRTGALPENFG